MNPIDNSLSAPPVNDQIARLENDSRLSPSDRAKLKQVARQFESVFLNQMVGAMRKTVIKGGLMPESHAEKVYQSMLDQKHAEQMSDTEQIGLSHMIYEHLLRTSGAR